MSYLIKQTKIEIDKNTVGSDDAEIIYMNYEHTGRPPYFIGEKLKFPTPSNTGFFLIPLCLSFPYFH